MKIYGLKNCDTCRKALKVFPKADFIDVRVDGVSSDLLQDAEKRFGFAIVNSRSTTWRGLDDTARARPALELLKAYPTLMKRPLIEMDGTLYLGWTKEVQAALGV